MAYHGKKYRAAKERVEVGKVYPLAEAITVAKQSSITKFDASVELHVHLGIDPKKADQMVRGTVVLPHGTGKTIRIAAFVTAALEADAKAAGAAIVGGQALIDEIKKTQKTDFDVAVATPDMMKNLAAIAKTLGTRGLMPNPKNDTVTANPAKTIAELSKGKVAFRSDDGGNVHQVVGRVSFPEKELLANAETFMEAIKKSKPSEIKGTYLLSATLTTSMGPGVRFQG